MRIGIDAMGGDHAPRNPVRGGIEAAYLWPDLEIVLIGEENRVRAELEEEKNVPRNISVVHAPEVVGMEEPPVQALRKKRDSSLGVATRLQHEGQLDAFISAGNTGAVMAFSLTGLGRLEGVERPALATLMPTEQGTCVVLDVGANLDSKPVHLVRFGIMGSLFTNYVLGREKPKVGLLSVGEESTKGDALTVRAHELLAKTNLNFIGNVEGQDVLKGKADVVVCDGFVGNVILKFTESVMSMLEASILKYVYTSIRARAGVFLMRPILRRFAKDLDYEEYGGAPLLGIRGTVIICHGRSSGKAIRNAVRVARLVVERGVNEKIKHEMALLQAVEG